VGYVWVYMFHMEVLPMVDMVRTRCFLDGRPNNIFGVSEGPRPWWPEEECLGPMCIPT